MAILSISLCGADFNYSALGSKPRTFRLINLLPPVRSLFPLFGETVRVQIIEKSLEDDTPFDTLSYTWGNIGRAKPSRAIIVETPRGQRILKVYRSLELALLSLGARKQRGQGPVEHPLFVDQICINQADEGEKTSQVKLMGDIYTRCERVVVWLGPGTRRSDELFAFTSEICSEGVLGRVMGPHVGHFPKVYEAVVDPNVEVDDETVREDREDVLRLVRRFGARYPLHGVADVLGRPWFNRLWVIQEICLAPDVVFVCSLQALCFDCIRAVMLFYTIWNKERKALHVNGKGMSLYELVLKYSVNGDNKIKVGATLPEDRVHGLLGLARDEEIKRNIEVLYDSPTNVYTRFAALAVQNDLDVLLYSQNGKSENNLPSWVPDWSAARLKHHAGVPTWGHRFFSVGGKTINQLPAVEESQGLLTVQGYFVDHVRRVGTQGVERDRTGNNPVEKVDFLAAARFFDEIGEFLEATGHLEEPRFPYASDQHLRDAAAIHLADGGLSSRQFSALFEPAAAQAMLEKIHRHVQHLGHTWINTELTTQSYGITRIIRTIGIAPWYWIPASEVNVLRLCARDPVRAARMWIEGIYDFATDMICCVRASLSVQLTAWYLRMRRRYFAKVDIGGDGHRKLLEQIGLASLQPWEQYTSNLYKTIGRRLFLTDRGYLGLGLEDMKKSDVIVVLVGSSTPHVLRPSVDGFLSSQPTKAGGVVSAISNTYWLYVGEAFCEGIMDGEILKEKGVGEVTDFHIL